jgi:hypothetical protein
MKKYIIFRAEGSAESWKERKLEPSGALTRILAERLDCSDKPLPEPGYRPAEFVRVEQLHNPSVHGDSTHYRTGDWEVVQVHSYTPDIPIPHGGDYDLIAICICRYNPVNAPLKPMPERQVSLESFGGNREAYEQWLISQKEMAEV